MKLEHGFIEWTVEDGEIELEDDYRTIAYLTRGDLEAMLKAIEEAPGAE